MRTGSTLATESEETKQDGKLDLADFYPDDIALFDIKIAGRDWPVFPLTGRDLKEFGGLGQRVDEAGEAAAGDVSLACEQLWLLLRKGAPGMTPERRKNRDWNMTAQDVEEHIPLMLAGGRFLLVEVLAKLNMTAEIGATVKNPSPGDPSEGPRAGTPAGPPGSGSGGKPSP